MAAEHPKTRVLFSRPLLFVLTVAAFVLFGYGIALRLWRPDAGEEAHALERALAGVTVAMAAWLAIDWLLALTHTLTRPMLIGRTVLVLVLGLALLVPRLRHFPRQMHVSGLWLVLIIPVTLWMTFIIWRATITPPLTHDALSYHLPRAVLYGRLHGFEDLTLLSPAFRDMPANYELLLADIILLDGLDRYTEWLSAFCYLTLVLAGGALAWRWWRTTAVTVLSMLALAAAPIALLHSGADKNDLLAGTFAIAALVWGGRYWKHGDFASLLLLPMSLVIAVGTKPQVAGVGAALLPLVVWRVITDLRASRLRMRQLFVAIATCVLSFVLLGGYTYVDQHLRRVAPLVETSAVTSRAPASAGQARVIGYGDWANLWQGPYVMIAAPFALSPQWLAVPWDDPWFWKRYEIYFSHLGVPFALCFLGAPFAVRAWRDGAERGERVAIGMASLAALAILLPGVFRPQGMYLISLPRYAIFFAAPAIAWTTGAVFHAIARRSANAFSLLAAGLLLFFVFYAVDFAVNDTFAPLDFVLLARNYPDARYIPFDPHRATSRVDRMAGPHDVIAIDATWATWVHPIFGSRLTRPVYFIPATTGPVRIPRAAKWVVVERAYGVVWRHKEMKTLADARTYFLRNKPSRDDLRVIRALRRDRRFRLVWEDRRRVQAIFERVDD
jgi:hypothetical protein